MLLRSLLFMPGDNEKILNKVEDVRADAVILDLEDAVSSQNKDRARELVANKLIELENSVGHPDIFVRVNGPLKKQWPEDCRAAIRPALDGLILPMAEKPGDIQRFTGVLEAVASRRSEVELDDIGIILLVETARGVLNLEKMLESSELISGAALGGEDFALDLGVSRTRKGEELQQARSQLVMAASAAGKLAVDTVFADLDDEEGLREDADRAAALGFDGKLAVHPAQVEIINEIFAPDREEIELARRIVKAFEESGKKAGGVIKVEGKMVDEPVYRRAKELLKLYE